MSPTAQCCFCGKYVKTADMRWAPQSGLRLAVLLSPFLVFVPTLVDVVRKTFQTSIQSRKRICIQHFVEAAQHLISEMAAAGKALSRFSDPCQNGNTAYVNEGDLPSHIVSRMNEEWSAIDEAVRIDGRAVTNFLNECLHKYSSDLGWSIVSVGAGLASVRSEVKPEEQLLPMKEMKKEPVQATGECADVRQRDMNNNEADSESDLEWIGSGCPRSRQSPDTIMDESLFSPRTITPEVPPYVRKVGETKEEHLRQYFLVEGEQLLRLFRFCPECGHKLSKVELTPVGTAPVVRFLCPSCSLRAPYVNRWEGQKRAVHHSRERMFKGNLEACVSLITTGVRFVELNRFAEQMRMSLFSSTFFWKIFSIAKPAIETVYCRHEDHIMEVVRSHYEGESGLQLAADGAYDSRGYSALIGKVVLSDTLTKLILRTEVLHRSETDGISQRMEIEGLRRLLRWISAEGLTVASLTTDRSRSVGKLLREMEEETGVIQHYYDGWHLVKWLGNELLKVSKKRGCAPVSWWIENTKTHCWNAIAVGARSQLDIPPIFNTCLMHVRDVHEWQEEDITGPYNCCSHGELVGPRPETLPLDSDAYQAFRNIVLTKSFQRDLAKASPYGGTSICETKHALDRLYCRKEIFYPVSTYHLYAKLATMHINTLRLAEMAGERNVLRVMQIQRKYNRRKSTIVFKSPVPHKWRDDVLAEVLSARIRMLDVHEDCLDTDQLPDEIGEMMMAEEASESGYSVEL